ncbi:MAG TPA: serine/threonine-protein kinase [Gemmataceae bacterium]|jgi:serine/threonine-protein kinase|nr:serine/threonine-protein kinase [Gemmataceae bacterium]
MIGAKLGKWTLDKELGRGGMGKVYLAHGDSAEDRAALKVLSAELAQEAGFLQRFQREIEVLGQLSHPNIVRFFESGTHDGLFYYAMEYVPGDNFEQLLLQHGRLPWKEVLDAALQICPALKHAHDRGIIHRDIKPPNLLRDPTGVIKLTDFGIARVFAARHLTNTGGVVGTAEYLSPEQAQGKQATKRSDLYSLGVVLYHLLTGRPPFEGRSTAELLHKHAYGQFDRPIKIVLDLPHDLDEVVCQLLEKDPSRRPADGLVLQRQLDSMRRKLERKSQHTLAPTSDAATVAENRDPGLDEDQPEGAGTLMSRLMRKELENQNAGNLLSCWLNRPYVLLPLFLLCVGLIIWSLRPHAGPAAETLFQQGSQLMASAEASDWEKGWNEYLEPLEERYPNHEHGKEVAAFRHQINDYRTLHKAVAELKASGRMTEAQRLYLKGLRLCQSGDGQAARQIWQNLVRAFNGVDSEKRWVDLAQIGLAELTGKLAAPEGKTEMIQQTMERISDLKKKGEDKEAAALVQAFSELYKDDDAVIALLRSALTEGKNKQEIGP